METVELEIINWNKYQQKKTPRWFKVKNDIFLNNQFSNLRTASKVLWFFLMAESARRQTPTLHLHVTLIAKLCSLRTSTVRSCIIDLQQNQLVTIKKGPLDKSRVEKSRVEERKPKQKKSRLPKTQVPENVSSCVKEYCDLWRQKYGSSPTITGKDAGIMKRMVKSFGVKRTKEMLDAYFSMPEPWVYKRGHPLELFEAKNKEIARFMASGSYVTSSQAMRAEKTTTNKSLYEKFEGGEDESKND